MTELSDYLEGALIDHMFNKASFTQATEVWVAAATVTIVDSDTGSTITEPVGFGYARAKTYTNDWTRAGNTIDNDLNIEFPIATGSWGTISDCALIDAATFGNMWCYTPLTTPKAIDNNDVLRFLAGDLDFLLD